MGETSPRICDVLRCRLHQRCSLLHNVLFPVQGTNLRPVPRCLRMGNLLLPELNTGSQPPSMANLRVPHRLQEEPGCDDGNLRRTADRLHRLYCLLRRHYRIQPLLLVGSKHRSLRIHFIRAPEAVRLPPLRWAHHPQRKSRRVPNSA